LSQTIIAPITAPGQSAIACLRLSGSAAWQIVEQLTPEINLQNKKGNSLQFAKITNHAGELIDEVMLSLYKGPKSYTGEDVIEISCHGNNLIVQQILDACLAKGAVLAKPGEFTQRAYLNGKLDLSQAEAVTDIIHAESVQQQQLALKQLRGGVSSQLKQMREQLITLAALLELELDFSQEDVEFADRTQLLNIIAQLKKHLTELINSFTYGNAIKNGIRVVIAGKPNAGKSTLLNALLNEDRAIVSPIAGTTRDAIEETLHINGVLFRFIDTAGLRGHTQDSIEKIGIEKTLQHITKADIVLYLFDANEEKPVPVLQEIEKLQNEGTKIILLGNKMDLLTEQAKENWLHALKPSSTDFVGLSAKEKTNLQTISLMLSSYVQERTPPSQQVIIYNQRHQEQLNLALQSIQEVEQGLNQQTPTDLVAIDLRKALHHIGNITGDINTDKDILGTIFGRFCIGK
jgi:tRNA modification GTPase